MGLIEEKFKWDGQLPRPANMGFSFEDANLLSDGGGGGGGGATLTVAASDSLHPERADYKCNGTADNVELQTAIDLVSANGGGTIYADGPSFYIAATIIIKPYCQLVFSEGSILYNTADVDTVQMKYPGAKLKNVTINTRSETPFTHSCILFDGADHFTARNHTTIENIMLYGNNGANTGTGIYFRSTEVSGGYIHAVLCKNVSISGFEYGIHLYRTGAYGTNWINGNNFETIYGRLCGHFLYMHHDSIPYHDLDGNFFTNIVINWSSTYTTRAITMGGRYNQLNCMMWDVPGATTDAVYLPVGCWTNDLTLGCVKSAVSDSGESNIIHYMVDSRIVSKYLNANFIDEDTTGAGVTIEGCLIKDEALKGQKLILHDILVKRYDTSTLYLMDILESGYRSLRLLDLTVIGTVKTNTIEEHTTDAGVTIEGILLKDDELLVDDISEKTTDAGVTIEGLLLKNNNIWIDTIYGHKTGEILGIDGHIKPATTNTRTLGDPNFQWSEIYGHKLFLHDLFLKRYDTLTLDLKDVADSGFRNLRLLDLTAYRDIYTDTLKEKNTDTGITVDGCLIKDGYAYITNHTPSSASDTGIAGQNCYDSSYFYICIATNTWRRIAHDTWA